MPEKEGTMVLQQKYRSGGGGGELRWAVLGERGRGERGGVFGLVGCQEGVKYQSVSCVCVCFCVCVTPTNTALGVNAFGMSSEQPIRDPYSLE